MRISQAMITRNVLRNIENNKERLSDLQLKISTGREIEKSSDDPAAFAKASRFRNIIESNNQYLNNINDAMGWVDMTQSSLEGINELLNEAKNIGSNDNSLLFDEEGELIESNQQNMLNQIDGIISSIIDYANQNHLNSSLFGGSITNNGNVFDDEGNYSGNNESINRSISKDQNVAINTTGQQLIDSGMLDSLYELRSAVENAVYNPDEEGPTNIELAVASIEDASDKILQLISSTGDLAKRLDMNIERLETANINVQSFLSKAEDADMAETLMNYNMAEIAYKAALQTGGGILQNSLLDFIR